MMKKQIGVLKHPGYNGDFADDVLGFDPNGGGIYDIPVVGDVADAVVNSFVGNVIAYAFPVAAPFIYAAKTAQSLASGNEFGALLNAVGAYASYASPTATTTATVGGMDIAGINANLVAGVEMAQAGGASLTDIAKVMVGMGDQQAVAKVLTDAGYEVSQVTSAVNAAGEAASTFKPTNTDFAEAAQATQNLGVNPDVAKGLFETAGAPAPIVNNTWGIDSGYGADYFDAMEGVASGGAAPISQMAPGAMGDELYKAYQTAWEQAGNPNYVISNQMAADLNAAGMPLPPQYGYGDAFMPTDAAGISFNGEYNIPFDKNGVLERDVVVGQVGGSSNSYTPTIAPNYADDYFQASEAGPWGMKAGGVPYESVDDYFQASEAGPWGLTPGVSNEWGSGVIANSPEQVEMLTKQYAGFTPEEVIAHMAGSGIDPVSAEAILGGLGMDQFAVSDYMKANPTSFGNTYADPSFFDRLKKFGQGAKDLKSILGPGLGGAGGSGGVGGGAATNYEGIMSQLDPYWGYRKNTEIPMMGAAAGAAGSLSGLYQQSFTNPLQAYNTPEMQALNAQFMGDIERKDAAAGRMSQYGARDVQAQNQYLTNTLPAYRQNLQQGLGTLYNAAKVQPPDASSTYKALTDAQAAANRQRDAAQGTLSGAASNLQGSWNQMTGSNNIFDQVTGAVNTASNVADLYNTGTKAWNTLSGMFKM